MVNERTTPQLSDALMWLYHELAHIRRINYSLTIVAAFTFFLALFSPDIEGVPLAELEKFAKIAQKLFSEYGLKSIFEQEISEYKPIIKADNPDFFLEKLQKKIVRFVPDKDSSLEEKSFENIRNIAENYGINAEVIKEIDIVDKEAFKKYESWANSVKKEGHWLVAVTVVPDCIAEIKWPEKDKAGIIYFYKVENRFTKKLVEHPSPKYSPSSIFTSTDYSYSKMLLTSAVFKIEYIKFRKPAEWFPASFPILSQNWKENYKQKKVLATLEHARRELRRVTNGVSLIGLKFPKGSTVFLLPILICIIIFSVSIEVSYIAVLSEYCNEKWEIGENIYSPWIGTRNSILKWPFLLLTLLILPIISILNLFMKFFHTNLWALICIIWVFGNGIFIMKKANKISKLSFDQKSTNITEKNLFSSN